MNCIEIKETSELKEFAESIRLTEDFLRKIINKPRYKKFSIPKKNGQPREINAPTLALKIIQKWILLNILENYEISECAFAFKKGIHGIKENALIHKNNKYLLEMDLKDFYPSITFNMVKEMFIQHGCSQEKSKILAAICTYKKKLPQGAITSPYISNLICKKLDSIILDYCQNNGITFSRYADDLTFSCNDFNVLKCAEKDISEKIYQKSRFKINKTKTRFISPKYHQKITGITVNNNQIKASKKLKNKIRANIYYLMKTNCLNMDKCVLDKFKEKLVGNISFVSSIEPDYINYCIKYIEYLKYKFHSENDFGLLKILKKNNKMEQRFR